MRALDPEVVDAVWAAVEPLLPPPDCSHPLGCHRPRLPDRVCFEAADRQGVEQLLGILLDADSVPGLCHSQRIPELRETSPPGC